jgi:hypothetical protein
LNHVARFALASNDKCQGVRSLADATAALALRCHCGEIANVMSEVAAYGRVVIIERSSPLN